MTKTAQVAPKKSLYTFEAFADSVKFGFVSAKPISIVLEELSPEIQHQLMVHGLKQKIVDAAAIQRDPETGASASDEDKIDAMRAVAERLAAGVWRVVGESGGAGKGGLLQRALTTLYPNRDIAAWLDKQTDKQKAALRAVPAIAAEIDKIKAKSATKADVDASALLAELGDSPL